ncbi:Morn repeat protein [Pelomyxa schiedti]|nr:Morn repeat protein [Pelomyxa schiedti]
MATRAPRSTATATVTMVVEQKLPGGARYTGRLVNNKRDGRGTWTGTTGEAYDGHWCDDSLHGRGRYTWPSGDANDGEWHAGKRDGWGAHRHADGGRFEGLWRDGSWKRGAWHSKNGVDVYDGEWAWNETDEVSDMQGWGVQRRKRQADSGGDVATTTTTTVYEGEWDGHEWHGRGTWVSPDGSGDIYHGMFEHGKRSGIGRMMFGGEGGSYVGEWEDDVFHGRGVRLWANGDRHEGQWVCGREDGEGRKTWARDGKSFDGVWEVGAIRSGTMRWPNGDQFSGSFRGDGVVGEGTATFRSGSGGPTSEVKGTLTENGVFWGCENGISHCMGGGNMLLEIKERKHKKKIQSLKQELQQAKQKLDKQTECFEHVLKHIQHGVWMKSIGHGETQDDVQASEVCVMNKVSVTLEGHNTTFPESICSLCPFDKVVKMEVEKLFGVDENQQVVAFSMIDNPAKEVILSRSLSAMPLSQLAPHFPLGDVPEVKVRMMPVMAIKEEELKFVSPLGTGSYGSVGKFIHTPTGREVAVKTLYDIIASDRNIERFRLEAEIVSGLRHPNILKCVGTSITTGTGKLQIVSELMCCSLRQLLKLCAAKTTQLSIKEVSAISLNVAKGMDSLHRQNFMHRDLSSNNVLFDSNGIPKICDFGVSRAIDLPQQGTTTGTIVPGTPAYMAPQMFTTHYSFEGDIWGFGILVTEMLNGEIVDSPFETLPVQFQSNFMIEQKRLLTPPDVEEVDKLCQEMGSQKSSDSAIASCLGRRNASIDAVIRTAHSPATAPAAADLIVLVVQSCLSILESNRLPFTVISKLLLCVCTTIVAHHTGRTADRVTDDQVNESIKRWLNALHTSSH